MNLLITGGAGFIGSNLIHHIIGDPAVTRLVNLDLRPCKLANYRPQIRSPHIAC